jgi:hypothetical protein
MIILSAFIIGLLGSWHCIGMCGPLLACTKGGNFNKGHRLSFITYHLGRLSSYVGLGLFVFLLGKSFDLIGVQKQITIVLGLVLIILGLFSLVTNKIKFSKFESFIGDKIFRKVKRLIGNKSQNSFAFGLVNGFLPCGLVYITAIGALTINSIPILMMYMIAFGLGTIPLILIFSISKEKLSKFINLKLNKRIVFQYSLMFIGIFMILRGMELGIPFISPEFDITLMNSGTSSCH